MMRAAESRSAGGQIQAKDSISVCATRSAISRSMDVGSVVPMASVVRARLRLQQQKRSAFSNVARRR